MAVACPDRRRRSQPSMSLARGQSRGPAQMGLSRPRTEATPPVEMPTSSPSNRLVEVLKDSALEGTGNYTLKRGFRRTRLYPDWEFVL